MRTVTKIKKPRTVSEATLWAMFSQYIRLRDTNDEGVGKCFTCPRYLYWKDGDCGHGIGRQHKGTKYNEKNNHFQCKPCNGFEGGMREVYKQEMNKRYGPNTWDLMQAAARKPTKIGPTEIQILYEFYKKEVEKLKSVKKLR